LEYELCGVDILVNNAGILLRSPILELSHSDWETVLATDLTSPFLLAQQVARGMVERGRGKIINLCSIQNKLARPGLAAYAAAKAGLGSLTGVMCAEWAGKGIQVNGLAPGYFDTDMNAVLKADPESKAWVLERTPARRFGTPQDLAGPAVWLASAASDFVNGQVIFVDGGVSAVI
jgi:gluconate 5-dehydrogenase